MHRQQILAAFLQNDGGAPMAFDIFLVGVFSE
jgi:hypothetical protein